MRPDGRGGIFTVGYFHNLASFAGFSYVAYPSFNGVTTMPLTYVILRLDAKFDHHIIQVYHFSVFLIM